jgi:hypothetical protein
MPEFSSPWLLSPAQVFSVSFFAFFGRRLIPTDFRCRSRAKFDDHTGCNGALIAPARTDFAIAGGINTCDRNAHTWCDS